jgi:hypothetical protein
MTSRPFPCLPEQAAPQLGASAPDATALDPGFITEDRSASQEHHEGGKATGDRWPRSEVRHTRHALRRHGHHLWSTCVREPTGQISSRSQ